MASLLDSGSPAGRASAGASAARTGPSVAASRAVRGPSTTASRATKVSRVKTPQGTNSDHRKEQNRIASRNYREKRKQKLALLQHILHEPPASGSDGPSTSTPGELPDISPDELQTTLPDVLPDALPDFDPDFRPDILTDLLPAELLAPHIGPIPPQSSTTASTAPISQASLANPTSTTTQLPLDQFSLWSSDFTTATHGGNDTATSASASYSSAPVTTTAAIDTPTFAPWMMPFSGGAPVSFTPFLPSTPFSAAVTLPTSSSIATTSTAAAASTATETPPTDAIDVHDDSFDPAIGLDQIMGGGDGNLAIGHFFAGMFLPPEISTSYYGSTIANQQQQQQQPQPAATAAHRTPQSMPTSIPHRPPVTTTLPSRPSPRPFFASLATPADTIPSLSPPVQTTAPAASAAAADIDLSAPEWPSRRTRKENKPVVRAMLKYVQTLSAHQKRLILQALLQDDGDDGDGDGNGGENDDERFEEVGHGDEDDSGGSRAGSSSPSSGGSGGGGGKSPTAAALLPWRQERHRQVMARWNSEKAAAKAEAAAVAGYSDFHLRVLVDGGAPPAAFTPAPLSVMSLQCRRLGFRAALLHNSLACGLPDPEALFDEAQCHEDIECAQSPFALDADEARAVVSQGPARVAQAVAAVRQGLARRGNNPPRDLQPVDAQILVAHHPYIDIIPFGGFRARALALLAEMEAAEEVAAAVAEQIARSSSSSSAAPVPYAPCLLDEDELCYDMNVADGLICWGSSVGNGGAGLSAQAKRDSASARDMGSCVPWDMRSWEPQVWFLKKYWFLVGGWDDDMWRNCRWWHSMRGDELDYSVYASPGH